MWCCFTRSSEIAKAHGPPTPSSLTNFYFDALENSEAFLFDRHAWRLCMLLLQYRILLLHCLIYGKSFWSASQFQSISGYLHVPDSAPPFTHAAKKAVQPRTFHEGRGSKLFSQQLIECWGCDVSKGTENISKKNGVPRLVLYDFVVWVWQGLRKILQDFERNKPLERASLQGNM